MSAAEQSAERAVGNARRQLDRRGLSGVRERLDDARLRLGDAARSAMAGAQDTRKVAMRATEHYVAASPYMTIAIAACAGLALGMLIMAGRRRRERTSDEAAPY